MSEQHRNITHKKFCPGCDHYHEAAPNNGMCLKDPPVPVLIGIAQIAPVIARESHQVQQKPVVVGYYPPVGPNETCSFWTPRTEGEA